MRRHNRKKNKEKRKAQARNRPNPKRLRTMLKRAEKKGFNRARHLEIRKEQLRARATRHEIMLRSMLESLEIRHMFQKGFLAKGVMFIADFYLPRPRGIVIEVDGSSHNSQEQQVKDALRDAYFQERGFRIVRITNTEVEGLTREALTNLIKPMKRLSRRRFNIDDELEKLNDPAEQFWRYARETG